jgi:hypothetical protein
MPLDDLDDNTAEPTASTGSQTLDDADTGLPASDAPAGSSAADAPEDTLSIVRDVIEDRTDPASSTEGEEGGSEPAASATTQETAPDDEDFSDVPFHKHPRFQQLLRKSKALESDATRYNHVQQFMDTNGITNEEAADGFIIMGLMKTDPQAAWERLKPIVQNLLVAAGEVLPQDLKTMVDGGQMTPEAAFEVSRSRASVNTVKANQTFQQQRDERTQAQQHADSLFNEAVSWETDRKAKDPNFEAKRGLLQREVAFLQRQEGVPRTPEGVKDQLNRAYKAIVLPPAVTPAPRQRTAPRLPASSQVAGTAQPKVESTLDIIRAAKAKRA